MEIEKLKLILNRQILLPFLSSAVFILLLYYVNINSSQLSIWLFFFWCVYVYKNFFYGQLKIFWTFLTLSIVSVSFALSGSGFIYYFGFIVFGIIVYMLIGSSNVLFHNYKIVFAIAYYSMVFVLVGYFFKLLSKGSIIVLPVAFFTFYLIERDFIRFMMSEFNRRTGYWIATFSFLSLQLIWISYLMSISSFGAASLGLIFWIIAFDTLYKFFNGQLNGKEIVKNIILFYTFSLLAIAFTLIV